MTNTSEEQQTIINHLKQGTNVIVDACAGSGKSTTIISSAIQMPSKHFLVVTYNAMLCKEMREKVTQLNCANIKVHTYHSLAVAHYLSSAYTDSGLRKILYKNMPICGLGDKKYDIMVLDETQDMSKLYYQFVVKFIRDIDRRVQLFILGDYKQGLYEFKGSDIRFLTHSEQIWSIHGGDLLSSSHFVKCQLRTSYRITNQMAKFVNCVMLGEDRIQACRDGEPVVYIRGGNYQIHLIVIHEIRELLTKGVLPDEIFIIGASVKNTGNMRKMENILSEAGIPCYVPMSETEAMDERVIRGKIVFSTFHSVKGRQRAYVFVVGFDQNYFTYYNRDIDPTICPNTLYVACTRATTKLYVMEENRQPTDQPLKFLKLSHHEMIAADYITFKGTPQTHFFNIPDSITENKSKIQYTTPTKMIEFLPEIVLEQISPRLPLLFEKVSTNATQYRLEIPNVISTKSGFFEDVSDINGITIPCIYYDYLRKNDTKDILYEIIEHGMDSVKEGDHRFLKTIIKELPQKCSEISDYLYMANVYIAVQEKLYFRLKQIDEDEYNWLAVDILKTCTQKMDDIIGDECMNDSPEAEYTMIHYKEDEEHGRIDQILATHFPNKKFRFSARLDLVTDKSIWELKCTVELTEDHYLQVIIYAWLWKMIYDEDEQRDFRLFNIRTGEQFRLTATENELTDIVVMILQSKYQKNVYKSDDEFLTDVSVTISNT